MYQQTASFYPAAGKRADLRAVLEEQVRDRQGRGLRANLSTTAWGADTPAFHIGIQYADMAAAQRGRAEIGPSQKEWQARQAPSLRRTPDLALYEVIVPTNAGATPVGFTQRVVNTARVGEQPALRTLLTEWVQGQQATSRIGLLQQAAGPESGSFTVITLFENLSEFEALRARRLTEPERQAYFAKRDALLAAPVSLSVREVLIPFPD